jgi:hypothetical protein
LDKNDKRIWWGRLYLIVSLSFLLFAYNNCGKDPVVVDGEICEKTNDNCGNSTMLSLSGGKSVVAAYFPSILPKEELCKSIGWRLPVPREVSELMGKEAGIYTICKLSACIYSEITPGASSCNVGALSSNNEHYPSNCAPDDHTLCLK